MKNGMKFLAVGAAFVGAALGVAAYRKYRDSYEQLAEEEAASVEEADFEPVIMEEDDFTYYVDDPDQIMFHE